jgi:homoserine kinase type II
MDPDPPVESLVAHWEVGRLRSAQESLRGSRNRIWQLTTDFGRYALRQCRHAVPDVEREIELIRYAAARGIPTPEPLRMPDGRCLLVVGGAPYLLFPFVSDMQIERHAPGPGHLRAMGLFLGDLHLRLRDGPHALVRHRPPLADASASLARLDHFEALIRGLDDPVDTDVWLLERLDGRRRCIEAGPDRDPSGYDELAKQPIHGDYQDQNLFFAEGRVSAVIDWEHAFVGPTAWDVVRFVGLVTQHDAHRSRAFLRAYLEVAPTTWEILDAVALARTWSDTLSLWLYEGIYEQDNERLRRFVNPPPFDPPWRRWRRLREALGDDLG